MNKAVIYFGATGNEAADQMVMQVLEEYCTVNGYEIKCAQDIKSK